MISSAAITVAILANVSGVHALLSALCPYYTLSNNGVSVSHRFPQPRSCLNHAVNSEFPNLFFADELSEEKGDESQQINKNKSKEKRKGRKKWVETRKPVSELKLGQDYPGEVVAIRPFGAYVKLRNYAVKGLGALLRTSALRKELPVGDQSNHQLHVGQKINVRIRHVNPESKEVAVSIRPPTRKKRKISVKELAEHVGEMFDGRVVSIAEFGAFVDIGATKNGLLHKSRIIRSERVDDVANYLQVGQKIRVRIISVNVLQEIVAVSMLSEESDMFLDRRKNQREKRQKRGKDMAVTAAFQEDDEVSRIANALIDGMEGEMDTFDEIFEGRWSALPM